jgi:hypothetical protein
MSVAGLDFKKPYCALNRLRFTTAVQVFSVSFEPTGIKRFSVMSLLVVAATLASGAEEMKG